MQLITKEFVDSTDLIEGAPTLDEGGLWDAGDWYENSKPDITAATTDEELKALIPVLEAEANTFNVVLDGLEEYLNDLREEMRFEDVE